MELIDVSTHAAGFAMHAYKDDFKDMRLLYLESKNDPCLDKIREEAIVKYGARNLLSAFYYWARATCCSQTSGFRVTFLLLTGF
ncbi:hypothetical protein CAL7716_041790 [Calothrix sp. PCC 7716]|nr:hypothetical protein CAL7716_041790 [Calothrix sp. PCC 7716]